MSSSHAASPLQQSPRIVEEEEERDLADTSAVPPRLERKETGECETRSVGTNVVELSAEPPLSRHVPTQSIGGRPSAASEMYDADLSQSYMEQQAPTDESYHLIDLGNSTNVLFYSDNTPIEAPGNLLMAPEPLDASVGVRQPGLSSDEATHKLLAVSKSVLEEHRRRIYQSFSFKIYFKRPEVWGSVLSILLLLASYIMHRLSVLDNSQTTPHPSSYLVEMALLLLCLLWNTFLFFREMKTTLTEMSDRAHTVIEQIERNGLNMVQEIKIPEVPSVSVTRVIRDGVIRSFPNSLLVEGDIIELHYGDVAPCRCEYVYVSRSKVRQPASHQPAISVIGRKPHARTATTASGNSPAYVLEANQGFRPTLFGIPPPPLIVHENQLNHGRYQFELLETPIAAILRSALTPQRPKSVIQNQLIALEHFFVRRALVVLLAVSLIVNVLRFIFAAFSAAGSSQQILPLVHTLLLVPQVNSVLPMFILPLSFPTLWLLFRNWGNAHLLALWEALQSSQTDYEDDAEVDAFDEEAPPPTKDVVLGRAVVMSRFLSLLTKWDKSCLTRSTNLLESLGSMSVLCCLDREGTITASFPSVEQVMFPQDDKDKDVTLDLTVSEASPNGILFEDRDWQVYLPQLKPLGLVLLLSTNCGVLRGRKCAEHHRALNNIHIHVKTRPARQSCLCMLGREIGFQDDVLRTLRNLKEIYTVSPYHPSLFEPIADYEFEIPSMLSQIFCEQRTGTFQLMSVGSPELILDACSDTWDGRGLRPLHDSMEKRLYDFYLASVANDCQVIAYAYRPITASQSNIPFLSELGQNSFAYVEVPYRASDCAMSLQVQQPGSDTLQGRPRQQSESETSIDTTTEMSQASTSLPRSRRPSARRYATAESDGVYRFPNVISPEDEKAFYKDVTKGQIFLGMAAFKHPPKEDVCDVIEDIGLGGIRFVYFSPTGERQTKAFGEQLGLETDWNCCILLSSPDDVHASKTGYVEPHDIKAQLPRGVEAIRHHLRNVDDIPLHVSLFAESSPPANLEMIRILQEYGEVVCCVGSALSDANTACFAQADIGVAVEPVRTRVPPYQHRRESHADPPPLSIGASLMSLPCGLFMHSDTSMYALTQLVREARRLCGSGRQGFVFLVGTQLATCLYLILSYCLLLPPVLSGYQLIWLGWLLFPILSASFLFNPHEQDTMKIFTEKNVDHLKDLRRFLRYFVLRFLPAVAMSIVIYMITLVSLSDQSHLLSLYGDLAHARWMLWPTTGQWALLYAQNMGLLAFVFYMVLISSTFLHRTESIMSFLPYKNIIWSVTAIACLGAQVLFSAVSLIPGPFHLFAQLPWYLWLLMFGWSMPLLVIQERVTQLDRRQFVRFQKRSKLEFNTRLGMHSPV
ncbi:hypothetical protein RI367_006872 [Sorochytrium milnesiophthora]